VADEYIPYNPDINAPTAPVVEPAPDGQIDWDEVGKLLDEE